MAYTVNDSTDLEMTRYNEAADIKKYSGASVDNVRGGYVQHDPIRKVEGVYIDLPSGGKLRVGDRPVQVAQADTMLTQTDATAAAPAALVPTATPAPVSLRPTAAPAAARQPIAEYDAQLRASSDRAPTAANFEAGGYTPAEIATLSANSEMVPMKMTPAQTAEYAKQPGSQIVSDYKPPEFFDGTISETIKGLVSGAILDPVKFVTNLAGETNRTLFQIVDPQTGEFDPQIRIVSAEEMANIMKMPFAPVGLEDMFKSDPQAGTGAKLVGGVAQFVGAFAGLGKFFKIGKGYVANATQAGAADFLGFQGDSGRASDFGADLLLQLGVPENKVFDFMRTDPNDPDYVGRFKNALEGAVLGGLVDVIGPAFRLIKEGGSTAKLGQAFETLRFKAKQVAANSLSDAIGVGRAVAAGDTRMLGEIFQPAGTPRSLGAAANEPSKIRPTEVDPNNLVFRESQQNRLESVKEMFPKGERYYPVVSIFDNGERTILDGHNRAAVAMERGDTIPTVDITKNEYDALVAAGFDDMEISYAALSRAKQDEAASAINQQFSGANVAERGTEAENILDNLAAAPIESVIGGMKQKVDKVSDMVRSAYGVTPSVSYYPTKFGNSAYLTAKIPGPGNTFATVGFRLSDHDIGDFRRQTDQVQTIIDEDKITPEELFSRVDAQYTSSIPAMEKLQMEKASKETISENSLQMWGKLSSIQKENIAKSYAQDPLRLGKFNKPWKYLSQQEKAEYSLLSSQVNAGRAEGKTPSAGAAADTSYRMQHQPRGPQDESPIRLDNLTKSTTGENAGYPADFYSANGPRIYAPGPQFAGDEFGQANRESYKAIMAVKGKPDAEVTIYRAVPNDPKITSINEGDFVTLSPTYAKLHGASGYGPKGEDAGKIISQKVKVKDIYFDGNDVNEFGYFPETAAPSSAMEGQ